MLKQTRTGNLYPAPQERTVTFKIRRFDPQVDKKPRWERYEVTVKPMMSVLDALFEIMEKQDGTLAFRCSCRAKMCGSCGMVINGKEGLACSTRLDRVGKLVSVEPLRHMPVVKDLVTDMESFFEHYAEVKPYFVGGNATEPAVISPAAGMRDVIDRQLDCITCGACFSACPVVENNPRFLGPAALNRAFNLIADIRDDEPGDRQATIEGQDGVFSCRNSYNCVAVCPVNVMPLLSIQRLRQRALLKIN